MDPASAPRSPYRNVPNALTSLRLGLGLGFPFLPRDLWLAAVGVALVTEYLDGAISRRYGFESRLGLFLDPIADKVFVAAVLVTMMLHGLLHPLAAFFIAFRDLTVTIAALWYWSRRRGALVGDMRPTTAGKVATTLQLCLLLALLGGWSWPPLVYATAAVSVYAGLDYIVSFGKRRGAPPQS